MKTHSIKDILDIIRLPLAIISVIIYFVADHGVGLIILAVCIVYSLITKITEYRESASKDIRRSIFLTIVMLACLSVLVIDNFIDPTS
jgi:hypothetical protein